MSDSHLTKWTDKTYGRSEPQLKGIIELEYVPIVCNQCNKILVDTYTRKDDQNRIQPIFIYCDKCGKDKGLSQ